MESSPRFQIKGLMSRSLKSDIAFLRDGAGLGLTPSWKELGRDCELWREGGSVTGGRGGREAGSWFESLVELSGADSGTDFVSPSCNGSLKKTALNEQSIHHWHFR